MRVLSTAALVLSLAATAALAQPEPKPTSSWFSAEKVAENVWRIDDHGSDNIYLVAGKTRALLVDTGLGVGRLADFVRTLTPLPVDVVNTHGHPDHSGGNNEFARVHAHPLDFASIRLFGTRQARQDTITRMAKAAAAGTMSVDEALRLPPAELVPVKGGHVFELGGRRLEVIEQPGHTPGEIVLLDAANRILLTGDNDNTLVWLFLPTCLPLEVYLDSLKKLKARDGEFDTILPGHGAPLPKAFLADQIGCVQSILEGTWRGRGGSSSARARPSRRERCSWRTHRCCRPLEP